MSRILIRRMRTGAIKPKGGKQEKRRRKQGKVKHGFN